MQIQPTQKAKKLTVRDKVVEELVSDLSNEEILETREKLNQEKKIIDERISVLSVELLKRLKHEKSDGMVVEKWGVTKITKVSFVTTIEQARPFGAVKETVDTAILKKLHDSGTEIPGSKVTEYVMVRDLEAKSGTTEE